MSEKARIWAPLFAWVAVWAFWLLVTRAFHPTLSLALIVTSSLVIGFALATYTNHFYLIPHFWRRGKRLIYILALLGVMAGYTSLALLVIRLSYHFQIGPDPDPYGTIRHFLIDFFGMAVHVAVAFGAFWLFSRRP